jgi:hypothetical protein
MAKILTSASAGSAPRIHVHRGLGSIAPAVLRDRCVDPATRRGRAVSGADVEAVIAVFGRDG